MSRPLAIDVFGPPAGPTGWATHTAGFAQALARLAHVRLRTSPGRAQRALFGPLGPLVARGCWARRGDFGVVIDGEPGARQPAARWIVWETTVLPEAQRRLCASVPWLWTPSRWGREILIANGVAAERVAVVPEGVDTDFFRPAPRPKPAGPFRFLLVGKWEVRKCCRELIAAFAAEFRPGEDVELHLHAHNPYRRGFSLEAEIAAAGPPAGLRVVAGRAGSREDLRRLYQAADCFVLPTRAEGWGLPILEAMACGVPAIVTRYSAPREFVTEDNGYLLDVARRVDAVDPDFGIATGQWAEPDFEHLRRLMRRAFEDREELRVKGGRACRDAQQFSWDRSAAIALERIEACLGRAG